MVVSTGIIYNNQVDSETMNDSQLIISLIASVIYAFIAGVCAWIVNANVLVAALFVGLLVFCMMEFLFALMEALKKK